MGRQVITFSLVEYKGFLVYFFPLLLSNSKKLKYFDGEKNEIIS